MEDKKLTPRESMALIAQMIESSKQRVAMPDIRISVIWAVITILCASIVLAVSLTGYNPWINLVWLAIPVLGLPVNFIMAKKSEVRKGAKTIIDSISDGVWKIVGLIGIGLSLICAVFNLLGHPGAWLAMFYYAFVIVGFGAAVTGIVLKENSYTFGGIFSILAGFTLVVINLCNIPLLITWVLPLYILCFLLMFIVPAFVIRRKLNRESNERA